MIDRAVARGEFDLVLPRRVATRAVRPSTREQALLAVSLWLGDAGAISGLTAGSVWTLARVPVSDAITVSSWTRRSPPSVDPGEAGAPGTRVTSFVIAGSRSRRRPARSSTSPPPSTSATTWNLRSRTRSTVDCACPLTSPTCWRRHPPAKGRRRLTEILDGPGRWRGAQSGARGAVARLIRGSDVPTGGAPARRQRRRNRLVDRLRAGRSRVGVECDGYEHHGTTREAFDQDRLKAAALASAGWRIVPVTWTEATRRADRFLERLAGALDAKIAL